MADILFAVQHLNVGGSFGYLSFRRNQLECPHCGATGDASLFLSWPIIPDHKGTSAIHEGPSCYRNLYTLKQVSEITGLGKNTVKAIDLGGFRIKYTIDGQTLSIKPEQTTRFLGIDEFKAHDDDTAMPLTSSTCVPGYPLDLARQEKAGRV